MIKEEFQFEWAAPAPEFTAPQSEVADWSEGMQVPYVPIQQFPTENWSAQSATEDSHCSDHWMGKNNYWVVLSCSSRKASKMEIKLKENKQFLKKKKNQVIESN